MERIELNPLDKKDLLEILDYAKVQYEKNRPVKRDDRNHFDTTNWYLIRIEQLKQVINGKNIQDSVYKSSLLSMEIQDE